MGVESVRLRKWLALVLAMALMLSAFPAPIHTSAISLASGNHVRWIDRIANLPDHAVKFYAWLESNAHIDGALCDPTKAQKNGSDYVYVLDVLSGSINAGANASSSAIQSAILADVGDQAQVITDYAFEVYGAFDRDHPEVFWLSGESQCGMSLSYTHNPQSGAVTYELTVVFYLLSDDFDIRLQEFRSRSVLRDAMSQMERDVQRILKGVSTEASVAEQVRYLNRILTQTNAYNSAVSAGKSAPATAWKCTSALSGSVGEAGPVCEGYARAFKVLCDRLGIPCVLTEGQSRSSASASLELHMWNYVQVDGSWYAVDVTWNDPRTTGAGNAALSGNENENYLLVGSNTKNSSGQSFAMSHMVRNCVVEDGYRYTNGPLLSDKAYLLPGNNSDPTPDPDPDPNPDPDPIPDPDPMPEPDPPVITLLAQWMQIDPYRGDLRTAPQMEGYVFLGWFVDQDLQQPLSKEADQGYAYAAFVDEQVLTVKCQLSEGTMAASSDTNIRLLTGMSAVKPEAVVFLVDDVAYVADGMYAQLRYQQTSAQALFGTGASYILSYTIENIPRERFSDSFTVVPGWYTWDGTFVKGTPRTVSVSDGLQ